MGAAVHALTRGGRAYPTNGRSTDGSADDPAVPFTNARTAARIPNAPDIRGGGHLFLLDEPERAAGPIRAFLDM